MVPPTRGQVFKMSLPMLSLAFLLLVGVILTTIFVGVSDAKGEAPVNSEGQIINLPGVKFSGEYHCHVRDLPTEGKILICWTKI